MDLEKLQEQEKSLIKEMRSLLSTAETEQRELNEVEEKKFADAEKKLDGIRSRIEKSLKLDELEKTLDKPVEKRAEPKIEVRETWGGKAKEEHRNAFCKHIINAPMTQNEIRALEVGTAAEGGNLVPTDFNRELEKRISVINPWRELAKTLRLDRAMDLPVHKTKSAGAVRGEEADVSGSITDAAFGKETLNYWEIYHEVVYSRELGMQSAIDLEGFLLDEMAQAIAYKEEALIVSGGGSTEPTGLDAISTIGGVSVTGVEQGTGNSGTITLAMLINIYHAMHRAHRRFGKFVMNDTTAKALLNLQETVTTAVGTPTNTYQYDYYKRLLQADLREAPGSKLFGCDIIVSDFLADLDGDNAVSIVFVDPRYMRLADFGGLKIERANGDLTLMRQGQKAIGMYKGIDMKMVSPDALVQFNNEDTA